MTAETYASVIVYVRDDPAGLREFLVHQAAAVRDRFAMHEVVIVDDGSVEPVAGLSEELAREHNLNVVLVRLGRRHGTEAGMNAGLAQSAGDWVFQFDSPRTDHPDGLLDRMYQAAAEGHDHVTASGAVSSLRARAFYAAVNRYGNLGVPLRTERVRLSSRRGVNAMLALREKVRYRKALYAVTSNSQHHLVYVPAEGSRARPLNGETLTLATDIVLSFSTFGLRLAYLLSVGFGSVSLLAVLWSFGAYILKQHTPEGWTTVMVVLSAGLAGLFVVLAVLGEYLARILVEVRGRPGYSLTDLQFFVPDQAAGPESS